MTFFDFADRHPLVGALVAVLVALVALVALALLVAAQMPKMSEEEARANPRKFAFFVAARKLAPVIEGSFKALAGVLATAIAEALVSKHFGPTPTPRPSPLPTDTEPRS